MGAGEIQKVLVGVCKLGARIFWLIYCKMLILNCITNNLVVKSRIKMIRFELVKKKASKKARKK